LISKPELVRACSRWRPMASPWLLTVPMVLRDAGADGLYQQRQPSRQHMQAAVETRTRASRREVAQATEHVQRAGSIIPEGVHGHGCHGQHLRIAQGGQA